MIKEIIEYIKNICEHSINECDIITSKLEENLEDLDYEQVVNLFEVFVSNTIDIYKEILKQL